MLAGEYGYRVDGQGRVPLPPRFRPQFGGEGGTAVLTRGFDTCILAYPYALWHREAQRLTRLPLTRTRNRQLVRGLIGSSYEVSLDRQGRLQLPQPLRDYAGVVDQVTVVGIGEVLELWARERWEEQRSFLDGNLAALAEGVGEGEP